MRGPRAQVAVELGGQVVQAGPGGREVDPRGGVRLALGQGDLARQQQLAAADGGRSSRRPDPPRPRPPLPGHAQAGRHPLDPVHGVAAPRDVQAVDLAVAEGEAGHAGDQDGGRVVAGVAAAAFAQPQPVADPVPLRDALGGLPPGEVEDLPDPARQREDHLQAVDDVGLAAEVGQRVPGPDRAARHRLDLGHQPQAGGLVRGLDPGPAAVVLGPHRQEQRRPVAPGHRVARVAVSSRCPDSPGRPNQPSPCCGSSGHGRAAASSAAASLRLEPG